MLLDSPARTLVDGLAGKIHHLLFLRLDGPFKRFFTAAGNLELRLGRVQHFSGLGNNVLLHHGKLRTDIDDLRMLHAEIFGQFGQLFLEAEFFVSQPLNHQVVHDIGNGGQLLRGIDDAVYLLIFYFRFLPLVFCLDQLGGEFLKLLGNDVSLGIEGDDPFAFVNGNVKVYQFR